MKIQKVLTRHNPFLIIELTFNKIRKKINKKICISSCQRSVSNFLIFFLHKDKRTKRYKEVMMHNFRWSSFLLAASISHIALGMGQVGPQVADLEMQEKVFLPIDAEIGDVQIKIREFKERLVQMDEKKRALTLKGLRAFLNRKDAADYNIYYTLLVGSLQDTLTSQEKVLLQDVTASTDGREGAERGYPALGTDADFNNDGVFGNGVTMDQNSVPVPPRGFQSPQLPATQVVTPMLPLVTPFVPVATAPDDGVSDDGSSDSFGGDDSGDATAPTSGILQQPQVTGEEDDGDAAAAGNSSSMDSTASESADLVSLFAMPNKNPAVLKDQLRASLQDPKNHIDFIVLSLDSDYEPYRTKIDKAGVSLVYVDGRAYANFGDKKVLLKFDSNKLKGRFKEEQTYEEMLSRKKLMDQVLGLQVSSLDGTQILSRSPAKKVKAPIVAKPAASVKVAPASATAAVGDDEDGLAVPLNFPDDGLLSDDGANSGSDDSANTRAVGEEE